MATPSKRKYRTRTSKKYCEEKFCCLTEGATAYYYCKDCKTNQCVDCEPAIHKSKAEFDFHERCQLEPPPYEELCQIASLLSNLDCEDRNFADLHCDNCDRNFCLQCFDTYHKEGKKTHRKYTFKEYKHRQTSSNLHAVLPISPVSQNDDSLTFVSCPQVSESFESMMSYNSFHSDTSQTSIPDIVQDSAPSNMDMLSLTNALAESQIDERYSDCDSFLLVDEQESLQVCICGNCFFSDHKTVCHIKLSSINSVFNTGTTLVCFHHLFLLLCSSLQ